MCRMNMKFFFSSFLLYYMSRLRVYVTNNGRNERKKSLLSNTTTHFDLCHTNKQMELNEIGFETYAFFVVIFTWLNIHSTNGSQARAVELLGHSFFALIPSFSQLFSGYIERAVIFLFAVYSIIQLN